MEELMLGEKMGKIEEEETQAELGTVTDVKPKGSVFFTFHRDITNHNFN